MVRFQNRDTKKELTKFACKNNKHTFKIVYYITREESDKFHTSVNVVNEALAE